MVDVVEAAAASGAEIAGGRETGVIDLLWVLVSVTVAICSPDRPCRRHELHRADGAFPLRVVVKPAAVGVVPGHACAAVERRAEDRWLRHAVPVFGFAAAVVRVAGFDIADAGELVPPKVTARLRTVDGLGGRHIRGEHAARDLLRANREVLRDG